MLFLSISLVFAVAGMLTADPSERIQECVKSIELEQLEDLIKDPDLDEMNLLCSKVLPAIKCVGDVVLEETGLSMAEIARMVPDEDIAKAATLFVNFQNLLEDLCDEDSELHKSYSRHADCYKSIPNSKVEECSQKSRESFEAYKAFENKIEEEAGEPIQIQKNRDCLVMALSSACLAAEIHDTCGMSAFETYQTVVKRTNFFRLAFCSQKDIDELKTEFLDSLKLEDERKHLFRLAFDLRKRRK